MAPTVTADPPTNKNNNNTNTGTTANSTSTTSSSKTKKPTMPLLLKKLLPDCFFKNDDATATDTASPPSQQQQAATPVLPYEQPAPAPTSPSSVVRDGSVGHTVMQQQVLLQFQYNQFAQLPPPKQAPKPLPEVDFPRVAPRRNTHLHHQLQPVQPVGNVYYTNNNNNQRSSK